MKAILILCLLLAACGGGGGSAPAASLQTAAPPVATVLKPVFMAFEGDSTMFCYVLVTTNPNTYTQCAQPAPVIAQAILGPNVTIYNNGIGGEWLADDLQGTGRYAGTLAVRMANAPGVQVVLMNFEINDSSHRTTTQYQQDLNDFVTEVRAAGKTPVLEEPNPIHNGGNLLPYLQILRSTAQQQGVLLIQQYDYIQSLPDWQDMIPDGIHPDQQLYILKGQREAQQLQPLVATLEQ